LISGTPARVASGAGAGGQGRADLFPTLFPYNVISGHD